jgi:hypothetical protein
MIPGTCRRPSESAARAKRLRAGITLTLVLLMASAGAAQFGRGGRGRGGGGRGRGGFGSAATGLATPQDFDGGFQFCRIVFRNDGSGDGAGWSVDWPRADENLSVRLSELTRIPVSMQGDRQPRHLLVRLTDPEVLFRCPFVMMTEPGGAYFDDQEAAGLRNYLLKGGFLWADDFWGEYAWAFWENQLRKALPAGAYPIVDVPLDHPIFHQMLSVQSIPQIPSIGFWQGRHSTSERDGDSAVPHVRAINDRPGGRIMVLMTHNTDFGDAYEREDDDPDYFQRFSIPGYAFGVNVLLYTMTH